MDNRSEDERIADATSVEAFLRSPAVENALARLHAEYYLAFKTGTTSEAREAVWAKARALDDLCVELSGVVDAGTRARAEKLRRERGSSHR